MLERFRVLLVEDDLDLAEVMQAALEEEGLEVAVAHDGQRGLELIERLRPEAVVADLVMPILDGLQMIHRYLQMPGPHAPVIAVSAIGSRLRAARELGADEALIKPVHPVELANTVRKLVRRGHAGEELAP